ncbi:serine hydrolase [Flavobacterium sp. JAS]|uniref:serine hydrolase domain-containing protein n=1 Tax=Flavobacterium sp. JAS TaxID=2897329 RepID=UPI001E570C02|nr:serine hydrolase domain-containing protein [Flavobacterium sp. JAS]MCD0470513.1 beta-lactamase family protein [Flavobacterium sp. JAS]
MYKKPSFLVLAIFICLLLNSCQKDPKDTISKYYNNGKFNGAVLIAKNGTIVCDTVLGYANFNSGLKLKKNSAFYIASLSKSFTAVGMMQLEQKGLLKYDDHASKYVTTLPKYAQSITLRELLNHTSGIKDYEEILSNKKGLTNQDVIKWLNEQTHLEFTPGSQFEYSNSGYIILSLVIESITKESYGNFLHENIFGPLKMQNTIVYDQSKPKIENKAIGFDQNKKLDDYSIQTTGDGGIYSTVEDLYKFDKALRNNSIINKANTNLMYIPGLTSEENQNQYGFGWFINTTDGQKIASHTGGLNGFRAVFWRDLKNNTVIIALTNQGDAFPVNDFLNDLIPSLK